MVLFLIVCLFMRNTKMKMYIQLQFPKKEQKIVPIEYIIGDDGGRVKKGFLILKTY